MEVDHQSDRCHLCTLNTSSSEGQMVQIDRVILFTHQEGRHVDAGDEEKSKRPRRQQAIHWDISVTPNRPMKALIFATVSIVEAAARFCQHMNHWIGDCVTVTSTLRWISPSPCGKSCKGMSSFASGKMRDAAASERGPFSVGE